MLLLTRKPGEQLRIGDDIIIKVVEVSKGSVRIGIDAPEEISILRQEVYDRICAENIESAVGNTVDIHSLSDLWKKK